MTTAEVSNYEFDRKSRFCLRVVMRGHVSEAEFDRFIDDMESAYRSHARVGWLVDVRELKHIPIAHSLRLANWMKEHRSIVEAQCAGVALVTNGPILRFALSAIFLIQPMPCPYVVERSMDEARDWLRARASS